MTVFNPWIVVRSANPENKEFLINLNLITSITNYGGDPALAAIYLGTETEYRIITMESYEEIFEMIKEKYK